MLSFDEHLWKKFDDNLFEAYKSYCLWLGRREGLNQDEIDSLTISNAFNVSFDIGVD